jgi:hypothetical protein
LTQRPLTATELNDARTAYNAIGRLYSTIEATGALASACVFFSQIIQHATTDGKPLRSERVPTAADIGKAVKIKSAIENEWTGGCFFVGFARNGSFVVQASRCDTLWKYCIIDEEAAQ